MWVGMSQWTKQKTVGSLELMHIHINILCGPKNRSTVSGNETLRLDCSCPVIWDTWCLLVTSSVLSRSYRYITWGNTYVLLPSCQFVAPKFRKYNRQHLKDPFPSPPTSTLGGRLFFFSFYAFMLPCCFFYHYFFYVQNTVPRVQNIVFLNKIINTIFSFGGSWCLLSDLLSLEIDCLSSKNAKIALFIMFVLRSPPAQSLTEPCIPAQGTTLSFPTKIKVAWLKVLRSCQNWNLLMWQTFWQNFVRTFECRPADGISSIVGLFPWDPLLCFGMLQCFVLFFKSKWITETSRCCPTQAARLTFYHRNILREHFRSHEFFFNVIETHECHWWTAIGMNDTYVSLANIRRLGESLSHLDLTL